MNPSLDPVVEVTKMCLFCGQTNTVFVPESVLQKLQSGGYIQDVWPNSTADEREALISGTHANCWDTEFSGEDW